MPLKLVKRPNSDYWYMRGSVRGIRVTESTGVTQRSRAEEIRARRETELYTQSVYGRSATASFSEALVSYLQTGGKSGKGGSKRFMTPVLDYFDQTPLARIGLLEIEAGALKTYPNASPATRNRQFITPAVAVHRHGAARGLCPMLVIRRPKHESPAPRWIELDEANRLIDSAAEHLQPLLIFLLYTGARIGEALWLDWHDIDLSRGHVTFPKTKNSEARGVPLHQRVVIALANLKHRSGEVFRRQDGAAYTRPKSHDDPDSMDRSAGSRIKTAFATARRRASIEKFRVHDCRHTWATWHYIGNRDLLALMKLGGWKSERMVLRYAHVNVDELAHTIDRLPGRICGEPSTARKESA